MELLSVSKELKQPLPGLSGAISGLLQGSVNWITAMQRSVADSNTKLVTHGLFSARKVIIACTVSPIAPST